EATVDGEDTVLTGSGNGPISAFFDALQSIGIDVRLLDYQEHTMSEGASAQAASYIECAIDGKVLWGIGIDANTTRASLKAVVSAVTCAARCPSDRHVRGPVRPAGRAGPRHGPAISAQDHGEVSSGVLTSHHQCG